ncbi:pyridoxal phosphate-dependent aminotransferase [Tuwongella immobilis]|uniref:Aminotransferase n=1 Tax=Tuwongella immobilis TaxID=692036 RepID=A0A6C2YRG7_9BACT|nr:pyridoxal phosphate-dependent aminotransferase [Tuwongella immobilis]VIP03924.1 aspartate aminotransferase : Aspartate/tyrosine/aromatic aminotransferase OS=Singulisphaera acidiphila (strain ATCC BAA-1392 / DSM 18658 / VKM B-2454 / MOB10) GN=Sinac_3297 PE=3 SV=1: Aminotran_1_2 [Tuwongella immobilis]VTS05215.1 aspartate aminotransferase : Aspartate/tyrosine/aromatic aminotransferase OS=Singulisphaera acidiphila (strain ATCC BAA-1392 / DSM 18658 / VKM B-2454 / MOB10) GN=Sinac_3297 PE=3 SV=1: Ami
MSNRWIADRASRIEASGIRKIFELAKGLQNPVNLSIGQPDFDVPEVVKVAAKSAIDRGLNGYTVTQGIPELRQVIQSYVSQTYPTQDRTVMITSGTSGGLLMAMMATINPGDEVILFEPYFVSYPHLVTMVGGTPVILNTYPNFHIDIDQVSAAITPRTKAILFSSPSNPTGVTVPPETLRQLAELCEERGILIISDEIYREYTYDEPFASIAEYSPNVISVDGFGKSHGMTGWRIGFAHGPRELIEEMTKIQQYTFVCAPAPVQYAAVEAWKLPTEETIERYRQKRDRVIEGLNDRFEMVVPGGAFYLFPKVPWGSGTQFVEEAIRHNLLIIPGIAFGRQDTHFRISYAASDEMLDRGIEILNRIART